MLAENRMEGYTSDFNGCFWKVGILVFLLLVFLP